MISKPNSKVANSVSNMLSMTERDLNTWTSTLGVMKEHESVLLRVSETFRVAMKDFGKSVDLVDSGLKSIKNIVNASNYQTFTNAFKSLNTELETFLSNSKNVVKNFTSTVKSGDISKSVSDVLEYDQEQYINDLVSAKEKAIDEFKWVESERAGRDLGEEAVNSWFENFNEEFSDTFMKTWMQNNSKIVKKINSSINDTINPEPIIQTTSSYVGGNEGNASGVGSTITVDNELFKDILNENIRSNEYLKNINDLMIESNEISAESMEDVSRSTRSGERKKGKSSLDFSGFKGMFSGGLMDLLSGLVKGAFKLGLSTLGGLLFGAGKLLIKGLWNGIEFLATGFVKLVKFGFSGIRKGLNKFADDFVKIMEKPLSNIKTFFSKLWQGFETVFPKVSKWMEPITKMMPKLMPIIGKLAGIGGAFLMGWDIGTLIDKFLGKFLPRFSLTIDNTFIKLGKMLFTALDAILPGKERFGDKIKELDMQLQFNQRDLFKKNIESFFGGDVESDSVKKSLTGITETVENKKFQTITGQQKSDIQIKQFGEDIIKAVAMSKAPEDITEDMSKLLSDINKEDPMQKEIAKILENILLETKKKNKTGGTASSSVNATP